MKTARTIGMAVLAVNFGGAAQPFALDVGGRKVTACRITDETRTWAACDLPSSLPPYSFVLVDAAK